MVTFLSLAVLRLVGAARAEDDVVAAIDARADEFAEAVGGLCISAFVGGSGAAVGLSQVESGPGVVFGSPRSSGRLENLNAPHSVRVYSTPIEQKI